MLDRLCPHPSMIDLFLSIKGRPSIKVAGACKNRHRLSVSVLGGWWLGPSGDVIPVVFIVPFFFSSVPHVRQALKRTESSATKGMESMYFKFSDKVTRSSKVDKAHLWLYIQNQPPHGPHHHHHHHQVAPSSVGKGGANSTVWIHIYKVKKQKSRFLAGSVRLNPELLAARHRWCACRKASRPSSIRCG